MYNRYNISSNFVILTCRLTIADYLENVSLVLGFILLEVICIEPQKHSVQPPPNFMWRGRLSLTPSTVCYRPSHV